MATMLKAFLCYNRLLIRYPCRTTLSTSAILSATGDIICQTIIEKKANKNKVYDPIRTLRLATVGGLWSSPLLYSWHRFFIPRLKLKLALAPTLFPFVAVSIDQLIFSPPFISSLLFNFKFLETGSVEKSVENVKKKWWTCQSNSWKVWPLATFIGYMWVPLNYRVGFGSLIGLFWNVYLSWLQHNNGQQKTKAS